MTAERIQFDRIETDKNIHDIGAGICRVWIKGEAEPFARIKAHKDHGYLASGMGDRDVHFGYVCDALDRLERHAANMIAAAEPAEPDTIDIRPNWSGVLPYLLVALECGTAAGKAMARAELERMATAADLAVKESGK